MSRVLQEKVNELFEATKDLMSSEEIEQYCNEFNEWVRLNTNYSVSTLGSRLSEAGLYKKFREIELHQDKNAVLIPKHDKEGKVCGYELKHLVPHLCGLSKENWSERNDTTRVTDRLSSIDEKGNNGQEIEPDNYIKVTGELLESSNPHELAVGLIAATGRRPHEILARGKFTIIQGEDYKVLFDGQGKKRGQTPTLTIPTLYPASYIVKSLNRLRKDDSCKSLLAEVAKEFPNDIARQNEKIEDRRGNCLRRVVQTSFGGREDKEPLLNFRIDKDQNDCKALRAAYAALVVERDFPGSVGSKMHSFALVLGHIVPAENNNDRDLRAITTSLGYADYYVRKTVQFPQAPLPPAKAEKVLQVRAFASDFELVKTLQAKWNLPNQQSVVNQLVKKSDELETLQKQLMDAQAKLQQATDQVNQLQKQLQEQVEMNTQAQPQTEAITKDSLRAMIVEILAEMQPQAVQQPVQPVPTPSPTPTTRKPKEVEQIDYELLNNDELKKLRGDGAVDEKIRRAFVAITNYNDAQPSNDTRWAITNQSLRQLCGCNGQKVASWMERYKTSIDDHNAKYSLGQYHNKGKGDISEIIK